MISALDLIVLTRAEEQLASISFRGPIKHDKWAIKPKEIQGRANTRANRWRRTRCLAGDCDRPVRDGAYCARHGARVRAGVPVDLELYSIPVVKTGRPRFGGPLYLGRRKR